MPRKQHEDMKWLEHLSQRLRTIRVQLGISQRQFASRLKISSASWQSYESGRAVPGGEVLRALAELGCDVNWLLTGRSLQKASSGPHTELVPLGNVESAATLELTSDESRRRAAVDSVRPSSVTEKFQMPLDLERIAVLGRTGHYDLDWSILDILSQCFPEPVSVGELLKRLLVVGAGASELEVESRLEILCQRNLLRLERDSCGIGRYCVVEPHLNVQAQTIAENSQVVLQSMRYLSVDIFPFVSAQDKRAKVVTFVVTVNEKSGHKLLSRIKANVFQECQRLEKEAGDHEVVLVVAGALKKVSRAKA